jgi:hypothetical protein
VELDAFLAKLNKVKKSGEGKYMSLCPSHQDKDLSLSVTSDKEKILVHCFAGCSTESVLQSLGLNVTDLFFDHKTQKPKIVKTYDYTDETGNLLFQVCRLEPKSFRQRHKDGNGEWVWSTKEIRKVLYHLPDIIRAPKVYFVEGEKDADNLCDCGLVATTSPGGAKSWKDSYIEPLIGKKVVLIPDMDDAGLAYAREIAFALMGKAQLSCIMLPVKDVSDWISSRKPTSKDAQLEQDIIGDLEKMEQDISTLLGGKHPSYELIDEAIVWQHTPVQFKAENIRKERTGLHSKLTILHKYQPLAWSVFNIERSEERTKLAKLAFTHLQPEVKNEYHEESLKQDFDLFCADLWGFYLSHYTPELVYGTEKIAPLVFFLKPYIMQGGGTIMFAPPGRGKSNTALLWAQSVNSGVSKYWQVKQTPVLFINLERSRKTIERRLSCINKILSLPAVTPLRILNARGQSLNDVFDACRRAVKQYDIQIVILDSISRSGFGDLTENRPVNAIIDTLSGLCETWVALAHTPRVDETHIYGGVMFDAGADIVVKLSSVVSTNGTLGIGYEITKANDITYGPLRTYAMEFNDTGLHNFRDAKPYEFPELAGQIKKPMIEAITDYLLEQDRGDATASDIAEDLNLNRGNIANILGHSGRFIKTRQEGKKVYYGVKETKA